MIFDKDVRDEPITIFLKEMAFDDALNLILNTNGMVAQRVAPGDAVDHAEQQAKQAQYQDLLMRTYYLNNAKAKDAVNLLRTMLESKHIYVDEKVNAIVVREEPVKLQLAEKLLFAIDRREPEVELDVEVLEVNRTKSLKYGLNYAKQAGTGLVPTGRIGWDLHGHDTVYVSAAHVHWSTKLSVYLASERHPGFLNRSPMPRPWPLPNSA